MTIIRTFTALTLAIGLSACGANPPPASRGATPLPPNLAASTQIDPASPVQAGVSYLQAQYDVEAIRINVPRSLKVSEANSYKPRADIVWRGDGPGDRYVQISALFTEAMTAGTATMQTGRKVDLEIEVTMFHALTEKTRYSIGGMHEMRFILTLRDSATGQIVDGPRPIVADIRASGGTQALAEEMAGRTQHVVTVERLRQVIRRELSTAVPQDQLVSRLNSQTALSPVGLGQ